MKRFGLKGKSVGIEVILVIIILLLVLCMGFGYCLRFTRREGHFAVSRPTSETGNPLIDVHPDLHPDNLTIPTSSTLRKSTNG